MNQGMHNASQCCSGRGIAGLSRAFLNKKVRSCPDTSPASPSHGVQKL
ncbi:hypothetical protein ACRRCN_004614 [Escherichia coli]|nr:hypothetical protein [Escherichia coli]MCG5089016.1 hypothetical protein [Escherichia coli]MCI3229159.1 hypothetical protein [Escherichia coli]MCI3327213.1 hypothetical protein [Escherichia coli]MCI3352567.1 hypothetical protein [Escherichia coli]MCI3586108.1 hypothetical protein [Escherichia coli]